MNKEFCNYTQALALKELGFDEPCIAIYSNANPKTGLYTLKKYRLKLIKQASQKDKGVKAPLYQQAFRWFRKKHGLFIEIKCCNTKIIKGSFEIEIFKLNDRKYGHYGYETYEEAEQECLDKLIKIVKNGNT